MTEFDAHMYMGYNSLLIYAGAKSDKVIPPIPVIERHMDKCRSIEIETQWGMLWDFMDLFQEMYPDEFDLVHEAYKRRCEGET